MSWAAAMICALVVMLVQRAGSHWPRQKLRVWSVMTASWLAGVFSVIASSDPAPVMAFLIIDIAAAFVVRFHPRSLAQNIIGCLYVTMIALHVGYVWAESYFLGSHGHANLEKYLWYQMVIGWAQWVVLMVWSANDVGKAICFRLGIMGHAPPPECDIGTGKG